MGAMGTMGTVGTMGGVRYFDFVAEKLIILKRNHSLVVQLLLRIGK